MARWWRFRCRVVNFLLHHPEALQRVTADARDGGTQYTEAVINETLRLWPPAPITGRMTARPYELGDYTLDPGTRIVLLLDVINRDPKSYPDPDEFRPERFLGRPRSRAGPVLVPRNGTRVYFTPADQPSTRTVEYSNPM